jgi:hypothetical protein
MEQKGGMVILLFCKDKNLRIISSLFLFISNDKISIAKNSSLFKLCFDGVIIKLLIENNER